jgi:hypothetical protein
LAVEVGMVANTIAESRNDAVMNEMQGTQAIRLGSGEIYANNRPANSLHIKNITYKESV